MQAGDIGVYREFKDKVCNLIGIWKEPDSVEYKRGGNPKPPSDSVVQGWVRDAGSGVRAQNIKHSILPAGFNEDHEQWHIFKHDVYGACFLQAWVNTGDAIVDRFEDMPQDDDVEDVILDDEAQ